MVCRVVDELCVVVVGVGNSSDIDNSAVNLEVSIAFVVYLLQERRGSVVIERDSAAVGSEARSQACLVERECSVRRALVDELCVAEVKRGVFIEPADSELCRT